LLVSKWVPGGGARYDTGAGCGDQCYRRLARRAGGAPHRNAGDTRAGVARHSCSRRKKNVRAPSIPKLSPRATSAPPPGVHIRRDWSTLLRRVGRCRKRARWVWRKLNAVPKTVRITVIAATVLTVFSATNLVYHVLRKPTEVFAPVSGALNKTPIETWRNTRRSFASIPPRSSPPSCSPRWHRWRAPAIRSRAPIGGGG